MFLYGVLLTPIVSRACYVATALLGINQFWAHNAYFVKCKKTKPAQLLQGTPLGGIASLSIRAGKPPALMGGASKRLGCFIDNFSGEGWPQTATLYLLPLQGPICQM